MSLIIRSTPQTLEIPVAGPGDANRLFIFTGIVEVNLQGDSDGTIAEVSVAKRTSGSPASNLLK